MDTIYKIRDYIKIAFMEFLTYIFFLIIMSFSLLAFNIKLVVILYILNLCLITILVIFVCKYKIYTKRKEEIEGIKDLDVKLKIVPKYLYEKEYIEIIELLERKIMYNDTLAQKSLLSQKSYFTSWSHQIKLPIQALKLMDTNKEASDEIFRIEEYVESLLGYIRLESKSTDYVFTWVNLDSMIKDTIKKYSNIFISKKLSITIENTGRKIYTDEKWFRFMLDQIITNSLKYTQIGGIKIYLQANKFHIDDTGIGIKSHDLPRIFELGFTGYNGRVNRSSTGIGLSLVKRISENLGLSVSLLSEEGKGTSVIIDLRDK